MWFPIRQSHGSFKGSDQWCLFAEGGVRQRALGLRSAIAPSRSHWVPIQRRREMTTEGSVSLLLHANSLLSRTPNPITPCTNRTVAVH